MKEILRRLRDEQTLCTVYGNAGDINNFAAGIIKYVSEEWYVMAHVDPYGAFDGYTCAMCAHVIKIGRAEHYLNKLAIIISDGNRVYDDIALPEYGSLLMRCLKFVQEGKKILTVELLDDPDVCVCGYVVEISPSVLTIAQISHSGEEDGVCYVSVEDISGLHFCSNDEVRLEKMVRN